MKTQLLRIISAITIVLSIYGCGTDSTSVQKAITGPDTKNELLNLTTQMNALPVQTLTDEEATDILFMREEEKLARDSYNYFYSLWGQKIFSNISSAEQMHMDAVLLLIERYNLIDPVASNVPGIFTDDELQSLYDILAASGTNSMIDALLAGAEIEEVDLIDLYVRYDETDNDDIQLIYDSLMKGSRNHLRAFVSNLQKQGIDYQPLHLSEAEFNDIVDSPMEKG